MISLIHSRADGQNKSSKFRVNQPVRTINTSLHALAGYLDVGNDELFQSSNLWLQEVCRSFEQEGVKRSQNQAASTNTTSNTSAAASTTI